MICGEEELPSCSFLYMCENVLGLKIVVVVLLCILTLSNQSTVTKPAKFAARNVWWFDSEEHKKSFQRNKAVQQESRQHEDSLALFVQEVEQRCGLLADQVDAACVVDVVNVVPADALCPVFLLQKHNTQRDAQFQLYCNNNTLLSSHVTGCKDFMFGWILKVFSNTYCTKTMIYAIFIHI